MPVRHKKLLEDIRNERRTEPYSGTGYVENRSTSNGENEGTEQGSDGVTRQGTSGTEEIDGTVQGPDTGNGHIVGQTSNRNSGPSEIRAEPTVTESERRANENEQARLRMQRLRDRRRVENEATNVTEPQIGPVPPGVLAHDVSFFTKLRGAARPREKVKLFTQREAQEAQERVTEMYQRGSALLDEVLEIIVKDHDPIQIWAMTEEESSIFADMHLRRAQTDENAARSARVLLSLYDRFYLWLYAIPRTKASVTYIKIHGGFSFK